MESLVSILIPAYNAAPTIRESIESALGQTWSRKEIIIVDDGSTDKTLEVARQFAAKDVSVVAGTHQGAAATRNKAFSLCQGDYIQWLDADDLLGRCKIESQLTLLQSVGTPRTLASGPWAYFMHRPRKARFIATPLCCDLPPADWLIRKLSQNLHMQTATWLVSRKLNVTAGPWNTNLLGDDDGEYACRLLIHSDGVRFDPNARVYYRSIFAKGLSFIGPSDRKKRAHFASMLMHIRYLRSLEDSERVRSACVTYLQNWLVHFYPELPEIVQQAEALAKELGGQLEPPRLPWKYSWIKTAGSWDAAKRAHVFLPGMKLSLLSACDKILHRLERKLGKTTEL